MRRIALLLSLVIASSAFAERPRGAQRMFVPVVVHAGGINSEFRSDLFLFNRGTSATEVTLIFTRSGTDGTSQFLSAQQVVAPGQTIALEDIVASVFHTTGSGALELTGDLASIVARSTTYNVTENGKVAQSVYVMRESDAIGANDTPSFLTPVTDIGWARTNIGLSEIAGHAGTIKITIYSSFAALESAEIPILPHSHVQIPVTRTGYFETTFAAVEVIGGDARVLPYASVVDNHSGDPMYVAGKRSNPVPHVIPVVAHIGNLDWASGIWYMNVLSARGIFNYPEPPLLTFHHADDPDATRTYRELPGTIATYSNSAVFTLFEFFDGAVGQIQFTPPDGSFITTELYTHTTSERTVGQAIDPIPLSRAIGAGHSVDAIGVESSSPRRTNIGVTEVDGKPVIVRMTEHDADGAVLASRDVELGGYRNVQFRVIWGTPLGRVRFTVLGGTGRIVAYASVIENISGDPTFILAR